MDDYFDLYDASARAIKDVCADYKVGGPATASAMWVGVLIGHCHEMNVPIDFVTTHLYPIDEYCRYKKREGSPYEEGMFYIDTVKGVKETVASSPYPNLPIFWTEFNSLSADSEGKVTFLTNTALDRLYGASCVIRNMTATKSACDMVSYWVVSDIFEEHKMTHKTFSGTYGLVNINGIKKATYNAFKLMKKLRGKEIDLEITCPKGCGAVASFEAGVYRFLLWNNHMPEVASQPDWTDEIELLGMPGGDYNIRKALITEGHGSPYEEWLKMGRPSPLSPFEDEILRASSEMAYSCDTLSSENPKYAFCLKPNEVCYIEITPKTSSGGQEVQNKELEKLLFTY